MGGKYKNLDSEALSIVWRQRTAMETLTLDHLMRLIVGKYVPHRIHSQDQGDPTPEDRHNPIFQRDDLYAEDDDMGMGGEGGLAGAEPYTHAEAEGLVSSLAHCRSRDGAMSSASGHGDVDSDMRGDGVVGVEQFQAEPTQAQIRFMMRQVNHECATRGVAGFRVAPDNEESELSALLLMYADDLVLLTTSELHLELALEILVTIGV